MSEPDKFGIVRGELDGHRNISGAPEAWFPKETNPSKMILHVWNGERWKRTYFVRLIPAGARFREVYPNAHVDFEE